MKKELIAPNLYIYEKDNGRKYYYVRFQKDGKRLERSLGAVGSIGIRQAKALAQQTILTDSERAVEERAPTFEIASMKALADIERVKNWKKGGKSSATWASSLKRTFPQLGKLRVDKITRDDVLEVLKPMWETIPETARKTQQRLSAVFDWCIVKGYRETNPAQWKSNLSFFLPSVSKITKPEHHDAPTIEELRKVVQYCLKHESPVSGCILLILSTACRVGEAINAKAENIDGNIWIVPKEDQKVASEDRRVPLTKLALTGLSMGNKEGFVFVGSKGHICQDSPRLKLNMIIGRKSTVHGIRSTFRDWCDDAGIRREVAESCLSHTVGSEVERAYLRKDFFEERREALERWEELIRKHPDRQT